MNKLYSIEVDPPQQKLGLLYGFAWHSKDVYTNNSIFEMGAAQMEMRMPEFLAAWLHENVGHREIDWSYVCSWSQSMRRIYFKHANHAMLFKLRWA